jgi:hypothetical protein
LNAPRVLLTYLVGAPSTYIHHGNERNADEKDNRNPRGGMTMASGIAGSLARPCYRGLLADEIEDDLPRSSERLSFW